MTRKRKKATRERQKVAAVELKERLANHIKRRGRRKGIELSIDDILACIHFTRWCLPDWDVGVPTLPAGVDDDGESMSALPTTTARDLEQAASATTAAVSSTSSDNDGGDVPCLAVLVRVESRLCR